LVTEKLDGENCRAIWRAVATRDTEVVAGYVLDKILPPGPLDQREIEAENVATKLEMPRLWNLDVPADADVETLKEWEGETDE
jgi:hypothetical protein